MNKLKFKLEGTFPENTPIDLGSNTAWYLYTSFINTAVQNPNDFLTIIRIYNDDDILETDRGGIPPSNEQSEDNSSIIQEE